MKRGFIIISVLDEDTGREELVKQHEIRGVDEDYLRALLKKIIADLEYDIYKGLLCYESRHQIDAWLNCRMWLNATGGA